MSQVILTAFNRRTKIFYISVIPQCTSGKLFCSILSQLCLKYTGYYDTALQKYGVVGPGLKLTAAMDGLLLSPAGGWVTSAPKNITGSRNIAGL